MTKITVQATIQADRETVWTCRNSPDDIKQRNFASDDRHCPAVTNDLRVGGRIQATMAAKDGSASFEFIGIYTVVEPYQHLTYVLSEFPDHNIPEGREVDIVFESDGEQVTITETFDAEDEHSIELQRQGRQAIINNFAAYVQTIK